jgi:hypothetical protein
MLFCSTAATASVSALGFSRHPVEPLPRDCVMLILGPSRQHAQAHVARMCIRWIFLQHLDHTRQAHPFGLKSACGLRQEQVDLALDARTQNGKFHSHGSLFNPAFNPAAPFGLEHDP